MSNYFWNFSYSTTTLLLCGGIIHLPISGFCGRCRLDVDDNGGGGNGFWVGKVVVLGGSIGFSGAATSMSNCTCFFVFFCGPEHGLEVANAIGVRALTGLRSSVVSDTGFFSMDLISAYGVMPVVKESDRLVGPVVPTGLHRRRGGLTGDWWSLSSVVGVTTVSEADPSSYHTDDVLLLVVGLLPPSKSRTCNDVCDKIWTFFKQIFLDCNQLIGDYRFRIFLSAFDTGNIVGNIYR